MDKGGGLSEDFGTDSNGGAVAGGGVSGGRDQFLKQVNRFSHKISKPTVKKPYYDDPFDQNQNFRPPPPPPPPQNHQQPPVYNINKNDFRDMVQKLTGSPSHERLANPPPVVHAPKPQNTRLQRIRPPPLAHVSNIPHPMLTCAVYGGAPGPNPNFNSFARPLSPLPPLPSVHAAAESPVSAYMRFLHNAASNHKHFSGLSPLAPASAPPFPPPQFQLPSSPLPFWCSNSPKSPYPLLSPTVLSSPRWRDL